MTPRRNLNLTQTQRTTQRTTQRQTQRQHFTQPIQQQKNTTQPQPQPSQQQQQLNALIGLDVMVKKGHDDFDCIVENLTCHMVARYDQQFLMVKETFCDANHNQKIEALQRLYDKIIKNELPKLELARERKEKDEKKKKT